jgi:transposase
MKALSMDLRVRILEAFEEGSESMPRIAKRFAVRHQVVQKLKYQWRDLGTLEPQTHKCGRKPTLSQSQRDRLANLVRADPNLTLAQIRSRLKVTCCRATIWNEMRRQGLTHKKSNYTPVSSNATT